MVNSHKITETLDTRKVQGDGNCLFRALAFLISGNQEDYLMVRVVITEAIANAGPDSVIQNFSERTAGVRLGVHPTVISVGHRGWNLHYWEYILRTKCHGHQCGAQRLKSSLLGVHPAHQMPRSSVWGTEVEIFTTGSTSCAPNATVISVEHRGWNLHYWEYILRTKCHGHQCGAQRLKSSLLGVHPAHQMSRSSVWGTEVEIFTTGSTCYAPICHGQQREGQKLKSSLLGVHSTHQYATVISVGHRGWNLHDWEYILRTNMPRSSVWGTEVETFTTGSTFYAPICHGHQCGAQRLKPSWLGVHSTHQYATVISVGHRGWNLDDWEYILHTNMPRSSVWGTEVETFTTGSTFYAPICHGQQRGGQKLKYSPLPRFCR